MPANKSVENALSLIESDATKILGLTVGMQSVTPGQEIPKADAQEPPQLVFNVTKGTYIVIALDIDAPFPSFSVLSPILHWIQSDLTPKTVPDGRSLLTSTGAPFVANYICPAPPPGSAAHRYIFILYEQPADFDAKKYAPAGGKNLGNWHRMRYDLGAFEKEAKLGPVLAANYFCSK